MNILLPKRGSQDFTGKVIEIYSVFFSKGCREPTGVAPDRNPQDMQFIINANTATSTVFKSLPWAVGVPPSGQVPMRFERRMGWGWD